MNKISFKTKYIAALVIVALFGIVSHFATITLTESHNRYAEDINLLGKERMLVAKMIYYINNVYHHKNNHHAQLLKETIADFKNIDLTLKNRGHIFEEENKKEYLKSIESFFKIFEDGFDHEHNEDIGVIDFFLDRKYEELVKNIDDYVLKTQKESEKSIEDIVFIKTVLLAFLLIILVAEAIFIFLPAENEIKEKTKELEDINKNLEERVEAEIAKNKEQTLQIIHQSRLATMGEMVSMIAHQWRQPLASISAISGTLSLDVIMDNYKADFFQKELESIDELAQHLSSTIDDFRDFFKNNKTLKHEELKDIVEKSFKIIAPTLEARKITFNNSIEENVFVYTYVSEMKQVLLNIIKNAEDILVEKNISDPTIWIRGYKNDKYAELTIEDNGGGISQEIIDKIFTPYFSTKKSKDGTGLGLYMSKMIIEQHCNGILSVQNGSYGAKFTIRIPLDESSTPKEEVQSLYQ
ncbi:ATP-binding protein [Sulfurimonas sp. RIFCSPLOWO2_12_36_12]|uniref:ATP-binding protein n=1 Tax=Sulfurimonas sp. RIFCSPLOWO2_12_36_12 TaxID=1802253 RepID=UPI000AD822FC|nr:ATP-binding protein [Sulfurimonas sp. RIFCSPLOWO2_12_36_12]